MTVTLYQLDGDWGTSSVSPFCIKLEAYLRMAEVPFSIAFGDPRKAARGKVPWLDIDGLVVEDSQRAISALEERKLGRPLDARLTASERARGHALRRMFECGTYFAVAALRWQREDGWATYKPYFMSRVPTPLNALIVPIIRRGMLKTLHAQGTGRYTDAEVDSALVEDFAAFSDALGDRPFLFGDEPTSFDAVAYGFTAALLGFPVESRAKREVAALPNVVSFRERVEARWFSPAKPSGG